MGSGDRMVVEISSYENGSTALIRFVKFDAIVVEEPKRIVRTVILIYSRS